MNVAVLGASNNPEKYSYKAVQLLKEKGHTVFPVHPTLLDIQGIKVYPSIQGIPEAIHTVTLYVSGDVSTKLSKDILAKKPQRIVFNPGAENPHLEAQAQEMGILTLNACTLVMLSTNQF